MGIAVIGLDAAKFVLQAHALAKSGKLARRELRGSEVVPFSAAHLACRGCRKRAAPPSHEAVTFQPQCEVAATAWTGLFCTGRSVTRWRPMECGRGLRRSARRA